MGFGPGPSVDGSSKSSKSSNNEGLLEWEQGFDMFCVVWGSRVADRFSTSSSDGTRDL